MVVLGSIILGLLLISGVAQAQTVYGEPFFNFEYTKNLWLNKQTRDDMKATYDNNCPKDGVYDGWKKTYRRNPQAAIKALKTNPDGERIKRCHDIKLMWGQWSRMYSSWQVAIYWNNMNWNNIPDRVCRNMSNQNVFTHKCNDLPDWRRPEWRKKDDAVIGDWRKRRAAAEAERNKTPAQRKAEFRAATKAFLKTYDTNK